LTSARKKSRSQRKRGKGDRKRLSWILERGLPSRLFQSVKEEEGGHFERGKGKNPYMSMESPPGRFGKSAVPHRGGGRK